MIISNYFKLKDKLKNCKKNKKKWFCNECLMIQCDCKNRIGINAKNAEKVAYFFLEIILQEISARKDTIKIDNTISPSLGNIKTHKKIFKIKPNFFYRCYPRYENIPLVGIYYDNQNVFSFTRSGRRLPSIEKWLSKKNRVSRGTYWGYWIGDKYYPIIIFKDGVPHTPKRFSKFWKNPRICSFDKASKIKLSSTRVSMEPLGGIFIPITNSYDELRKNIFKTKI